jgi:glycosyltransferase involved in cell wall biosynthesis
MISRTLESVFAQDFKDFEVIVVDDGSRDNTEEVIAGFSDNRLRYFKRDNAERGASRNFGALNARGLYINFFDSDDVMYSHHLSTARQRIDAWGSPEWFHLGYDIKSPDGTILKTVDKFDDSIMKKVLHDNVLSCNGVFLRREIVVHYRFEEDRRLASAEDWELWIRLFSHFPFRYSNEITTSVIAHDQRSIRVINPDKIIARDLFLINKLQDDPAIMKHFGRGFRSFKAKRYSYIMLSLAEAGRRWELLRWSMRALVADPLVLFSGRYLASIRKILIR